MIAVFHGSLLEIMRIEPIVKQRRNERELSASNICQIQWFGAAVDVGVLVYVCICDRASVMATEVCGAFHSASYLKWSILQIAVELNVHWNSMDEPTYVDRWMTSFQIIFAFKKTGEPDDGRTPNI